MDFSGQELSAIDQAAVKLFSSQEAPKNNLRVRTWLGKSEQAKPWIAEILQGAPSPSLQRAGEPEGIRQSHNRRRYSTFLINPNICWDKVPLQGGSRVRGLAEGEVED